MSNPVIHIDEARAVYHAPQGSTRFGATFAPLGEPIGARELGALLIRVEPGRRAFPFHCHHGNEEMFIVLEGEGTYRFGEAEYPIRAGSVCAAPAGGPETAHQIINTGEATLTYIALSTQNQPDICEYPDSGKYMAFQFGKGGFKAPDFRVIGREGDPVDYYDGEAL